MMGHIPPKRYGDFNDRVRREPQLSLQIAAYISFYVRDVLDKTYFIHRSLVCLLS
jgi:hypothetical protein